MDDDKQQVEHRSRALYEEGARLLDAAWDDGAGMVRHVTEFGEFHDARASLAYARVLLERGGDGDTGRAERIVAAIAGMQETRPDDAHYGNFRWFLEDGSVTDLNAVEFVLDHLNALVREHRDALSDQTRATIRAMMELGLEEIDRLDVHPSYTNIFFSDVCNSVLGGEWLGDADYIERGRRRLDEWSEFTNRSGAPHEFNSPTYAAVDLGRMATLAHHTGDPEIALKARVAEERLWLHAAAHTQPEMGVVAGPHSRSYRDGWTGAPGYLTLLLWKLTGDGRLRRSSPWFPRGREEGHIGIARETYHVPAYARRWLAEKRYPFETVETADVATGLDITTYMTESYALGTASRSYGVGDPPEPWPQPNAMLLHTRRAEAPGCGVLFCRYVVNDKGPGAVMHESNRNAEDWWEEGRHVAAQDRNRAIVAYGLRQRTRPAHSFKLAVRLTGTPDEVWVGDRRIDEYPAPVEPGEALVFADGHAFVALIPLEPSDMGSGAQITLAQADGMLALDIENYRGPAKTFWEHRSQAGPFYKGNVRNAFIVEAAGKGDFADIDAFRRHIAAARITDSIDAEFVREIAYASDGGSLALRYSLWDMAVVERRCDGAPFVAPMGRAGATDGGGLQWLQARDSMIELADARLMAGRTPKWLAADADAGRYVFVNPSEERAPFRLETPRWVVECDDAGFCRVEVDEGASMISVEATGEIGAIRIRGDQRLLMNGVDVTASMTGTEESGVREFAGLH